VIIFTFNISFVKISVCGYLMMIFVKLLDNNLKYIKF